MSKQTFGLALVTAIILFAAPSVFVESFAQVQVTGDLVGKSAILTVKNSPSTTIQTFSVWLDLGDFRSYKTSNDWTASLNPAGILTFAAPVPLEPGASAQFGMTVDSDDFQINWNAFDTNGNAVGSGIIIADKPAAPPITPPPDNPIPQRGAIADSTSFRIVPERPNVGASIRIVANGISPGGSVDFYIESHLVGTYTASENGKILETAHIPENIGADRTNFILLDSQDNRKDLSIRLGTAKAKITPNAIDSIMILGPVDVKTSEIVEFNGTALQNSYIVITVSGPDFVTLESKIIETSVSGNWKHNVLVPSVMTAGSYTIQATNGRTTESRLFTVDDTRIIDISSTLLQFEPGDVMTFTGKVLPGHAIDVTITDPRDSEVYSEIIEPDLEGNVRIEFPTTHFDLEGTYILHISQNSERAIVFGGLGELPTKGIELHLDKINYRSSESINVIIEGSPGKVTIIVSNVDSADRKKSEEMKTIGSNGRLNHLLDLGDYTTGVYTMIVTKGNIEKEAIFGVNIGYGSGLVTVKTTKSEYIPGSDILVLGNIETNTPVLLNLSLLDPNGTVIKTKQVFSGGSSTNGKISDDTFRIPTDATFGTWTLKAQSGATNVGVIEFKVIEAMESGAQITVTALDANTLEIRGKNILNLDIIHFVISTIDGEPLDEFNATVQSGKFTTTWKKSLEVLKPGTYLVMTELSKNGIPFIVP